MAGKRLVIDLDDLEMALTDGSGIQWFLDTKTGEVIMSDELPDEEGEDEEPPDALSDESDEAEDDFDRYIRIDQIPSWMEYQDMADFADGVPDERLRALLEVALDGKGAFRRFKNVLADYPDVREKWFQFRNQRMIRKK
ncbi:MAG TPA: UPF0158 family protein [Symbiobacteriaceae bacterium]|nr:UPF0158 family protein [Symbiobacteriaceae bacterium]